MRSKVLVKATDLRLGVANTAPQSMRAVTETLGETSLQRLGAVQMLGFQVKSRSGACR